MVRCNKCDKLLGEHLLTAYGKTLCEDCWDEYICSDEGRLEYLIGICKGDYPAEEFDAEFLGEVVKSWNENKNLLVFSDAAIEIIEHTAKILGLM